ERLDRLARKKPRELPEGLTLTDSKTAWSWPKVLLGWTASLLWNVATWRYVPGMWAALSGPGARDIPFMAGIIVHILLLFAVLAGIGSVIELTKWTRNAWKLRPAQLIVERWPLRLDEPVRLKFHRPFRRAVDRPGELHAR